MCDYWAHWLFLGERVLCRLNLIYSKKTFRKESLWFVRQWTRGFKSIFNQIKPIAFTFLPKVSKLIDNATTQDRDQIADKIASSWPMSIAARMNCRFTLSAHSPLSSRSLQNICYPGRLCRTNSAIDSPECKPRQVRWRKHAASSRVHQVSTRIDLIQSMNAINY